MSKLLWLSVPVFFACSQTAFAVCNLQYPTAIYSNTTNSITQFSYSQSFPTSGPQRMINSCSPQVRIRSDFIAAPGSTDLTGSSPFGVNASTVQINGSTADAATLNDAKAWLANNFKISFSTGDEGKGSPAKKIISLNTSYNILPETGRGMTVNNDANISFFNGSGGVGTPRADSYIDNLTVSFTNTTKPSAAIIDALNGATLRIRLGTYHYKHATYNDRRQSSEVAGSVEMYQDLKLNFNFPTCTMANQIVNLATVPTSVLNSNQTANEQAFNVNINCAVAMPSKVLLATIKDSYTVSNVNTNGILINQPSLANRSNVDIQLRDASDMPLAIGSQSSFYSIPAGSTATTFIKALKARYFRSSPTATPGFVQTQATVSLDYQ
ncbi:fimbrial protein [Acinetobacter guillouiae]|uniref:fimbrial protein n=1 Tax=Acinetobacter guillouiae TaxID=106649 RepID=UPI003AF7833D